MARTVLITGANGSLGLAAVSYLLSTYPSHTLLLTVRNPSSSDLNTSKLRKIIAKHPNAMVHIETLDLASLAELALFCQKLHADIGSGKTPRIAAIIFNVITWSLNSGVRFSKDGLELDMAVNTLPHFNIILSDTHWPGKAGFEIVPPAIPEDLDNLVKYEKDKPGEEAGRGFLRYGLSRLVGIMLTYELNRRLQRDPKLANIRTLAVDPGGLLDSRAFAQSDMPFTWKISVAIAYFIQPLLKRFKPRMNTSAGAAKDVVDMAVAEEFAGKEGHFVMRDQEESSPDSLDERMQGRLFAKSVEWCKIKQENTVLAL
ncbi:hypothetical protein BU23DRAFT_580942 [Bimuria novae-zelandiae CBS 107.79]|uniref:NAD(P)-binding protein n=1 Tax=Bimuria novae-zelandiae CBS 107.79 TaxID=1447943 RepID=A0A6A5VGC2_9PLEO|nr:hypothetical protein BU23DRAFT_580942 [Bimuria novae-zelandiae CBS 107.79]